MPMFSTNKKSIQEYDTESQVGTPEDARINRLNAYQVKGFFKSDDEKTFFKIETDRLYNTELFKIIKNLFINGNVYYLESQYVGTSSLISKVNTTNTENQTVSRLLSKSPTLEREQTQVFKVSIADDDSEQFVIKQNKNGRIISKYINRETFIKYTDFIIEKTKYIEKNKSSQPDNSKIQPDNSKIQPDNLLSSTNNDTIDDKCKDIKYECNCTPVNNTPVNNVAIDVNDIDVNLNPVDGGKKYRVLRKSNKVKKSKVYNKYRFLNRSINKRKPFNKLTRKHKRKRRLPPPF